MKTREDGAPARNWPIDWGAENCWDMVDEHLEAESNRIRRALQGAYMAGLEYGRSERTRERQAREILHRVWINGECLDASEVAFLDAQGIDGTAFEVCMRTAGFAPDDVAKILALPEDRRSTVLRSHLLFGLVPIPRPAAPGKP